ncbi:MAG: hypothetical protein JSW60_00435 [Thermoplasmatales archaeon]|nr:MAG: hypothetical protein JSW60_00435 [Thermoplasmatales archaeon]
MKKSILVGCMLVLTLLLLMPIVSSLQYNLIENDLTTDYKEITLSDIQNYKPPDKFPLLFYLINSILLFRGIRLSVLWELATEPSEYPPGFDVSYTLVFYRCFMLYITSSSWKYIWESISEQFGWGWWIE